jgi:hypothetical protein
MLVLEPFFTDRRLNIAKSSCDFEIKLTEKSIIPLAVGPEFEAHSLARNLAGLSKSKIF